MLSTIYSMITRGKVVATKVATRTIMQVTGLDNEAFGNLETGEAVELLLPPGYVARPASGADIVILQCNGTRDHKVAIAGDTTGQVQADLAEGEFGFVGFGAAFIFRQGKLSVKATIPVDVESTEQVGITSEQMIALASPVITSGAAGAAGQPVCLKDFFDWAAAHTHPGTGAPSTAPPASGLSTNFGAS
jgi:phage gp45-like